MPFLDDRRFAPDNQGKVKNNQSWNIINQLVLVHDKPEFRQIFGVVGVDTGATR
jgi:hypothetical protein